MAESGGTWYRDWRGLELTMRVQRATGRGLIGIAEQVVVEGKRNADVITGTMRRSIHTAPINYDGGDDYAAAQAGRDLGEAYTGINQTNETLQREEGNPMLEVGSWVPYACVEEVGRGHRFMGPAVEVVRGFTAHQIMIQAFSEEALL